MTRKDAIREALQNEELRSKGARLPDWQAKVVAEVVEASLQQWENDRWTVEIGDEGNCTACDGWSDAWFSRGPVRDVCIDCVRGSGGDTND